MQCREPKMVSKRFNFKEDGSALRLYELLLYGGVCVPGDGVTAGGVLVPGPGVGGAQEVLILCA